MRIDDFIHFELNQEQSVALRKIELFLSSKRSLFILKGYAGSGKTTILKRLVEYLSSIDKDYTLMAPTGRAAKVIREKTGKDAYTVHKSIYSYDELVDVEEGGSFLYYYKIRNNADVTGKIFIVDEASMLSDAKSEGEFFRFGSGHLLSDLISYTRVTHENSNTKIIFVGDPCQLPPVGDKSSKAFDALYLKEKFNLSSEEAEMKEVIRQSGDSGILNAAAKVRKSISAGYYNDFDLRANGRDILNPQIETFLNTWEGTPSPKVVIASKNKTCLDLNLQIRNRLFNATDLPVQPSDIVIMGGNNYRKGIFNGEFAVVNYVSDTATQRIVPLRGRGSVTLSWRDIELVFPDAETTGKAVKGKMLENFLYGDNYLQPQETQALYVDFINRHSQLTRGSEEFKLAIQQDEYFNCLLMKYGYVVTCHKAQGGEWSNVFTVWDHDNAKGFNCFNDQQRKEGKTNEFFYRWAYTAITRASKSLYALNPPYFNSYSTMTFLDTPVINALADLTGERIEIEEIVLDDDALLQLTRFDLLEQPIPIQDHFIRVREAVRKQYIEIVHWERLNWEIRYTFQRETDKAVFKTFINARNEFGNTLVVMPNLSANAIFNNSVAEAINHLPKFTIKRNTAETIISKIEFDLDIEERLPFTRTLYDDISSLLYNSGIAVDSISHLQYKERYIFKRSGEIAVLDFEYNANGFFGRVLPVPNATNSQQLVQNLYTLLQELKQEEYAS